MMNNPLNSKFLEILSKIDKDKLEQVSQMVRNMSQEDMQSLTSALGLNNSKRQASDNEPNK